MYKFLTKNGQVLAFGLGLLLVVITYALIFGGMEEFNTLSEDDQPTTSIFNFGLYITIVLVIVCAVLALLFGVYQLITNPKGSLVALIGIAALVILFLVFYNTTDLSQSASIAETIQEFEISDGTSKFISAAIWTTIVLIGGAALSFVVSEVSNLFK